MRPPIDNIGAPAFPPDSPWVNVAMLRMDQQRGRPVLIEFWDFCRPNSLRTLPYVKAWHARYEPQGLRVVGVHAAGFEPSADPDNVRAAVARLGIEYPVLIDVEHKLWQDYENLGWPARYLFNQDGLLFDYHYGEGAYAETERAIQELLGIDPEANPPLEPLRPEDVPDASLSLQTEDVEGAYNGPYEAGAVWAVVDGSGELVVNGEPLAVSHPGAYELIHHERSTAGILELSAGAGVTVLATCFTPGVAAA